MMTAVRSYILSGSTAESDWWGRGGEGWGCGRRCGESTHCVEELQLKREGHPVGELHKATNVLHVLEALQVQHQDLWEDLHT